ncbi:MAG: DUF2127 domain-containing protein [Opitutae bacterium]|nr:DUF2127 domain-containing protein [Opitutae bacterium]
MSAPPHHKGLRSVAVLEAFKGAVVLLAGFGLLSFLGRDAEAFAGHLVQRLHLNPANRYPQIFITAMAQLEDAHLWALAGLAALYAAIRFVEAYGLWRARRWAEWLAALSGAIYIPFELYEFFRQPAALIIGALVMNLVVVGYMVWLLTESLRRRKAAAAGPMG